MLQWHLQCGIGRMNVLTIVRKIQLVAIGLFFLTNFDDLVVQNNIEFDVTRPINAVLGSAGQKRYNSYNVYGKHIRTWDKIVFEGTPY